MYTLQFSAPAFAPDEDSDYYIGSGFVVPTTDPNSLNFSYPLRAGRVVGASVLVYRPTGDDPTEASAAVSLYVEGPEGGSRFLIETKKLLHGAAPKSTFYSNAVMDAVIDPEALEYVALVMVTQGFGAPPTGLVVTGEVYIEDSIEAASEAAQDVAVTDLEISALTADEAAVLRSRYNLKATDEIGPLLTAHGGSN